MALRTDVRSLKKQNRAGYGDHEGKNVDVANQEGQRPERPPTRSLPAAPPHLPALLLRTFPGLSATTPLHYERQHGQQRRWPVPHLGSRRNPRPVPPYLTLPRPPARPPRPHLLPHRCRRRTETTGIAARPLSWPLSCDMRLRLTMLTLFAVCVARWRRRRWLGGRPSRERLVTPSLGTLGGPG